MNFVAPYQLYYRTEPVGCTSTVLYKMYKEYDVPITKTIATMMLSAIISDTLLFKSPTCTAEDKEIAEKLGKIAEVDVNVYGTNLLKAGTDLSDPSLTFPDLRRSSRRILLFAKSARSDAKFPCRHRLQVF